MSLWNLNCIVSNVYTHHHSESILKVNNAIMPESMSTCWHICLRSYFDFAFTDVNTVITATSINDDIIVSAFIVLCRFLCLHAKTGHTPLVLLQRASLVYVVWCFISFTVVLPSCNNNCFNSSCGMTDVNTSSSGLNSMCYRADCVYMCPYIVWVLIKENGLCDELLCTWKKYFCFCHRLV